MDKDKRKIVLVGAGLVGMSFAYALLNQSACDSLVLIDLDRKRAGGEAMDLNHGLAFAASPMKIAAGDYDDCRDADIVAICAGVAQKPGESRLALLRRNTEVFRSIVSAVTGAGFEGLWLIATNPVDIMTRVTQALSGADPRRVIGTGTTLDTARLRYMLGDFFKVDPRNVHAYVMGEHGDSEFVPWSQAFVATKPVLSFCEEDRMPSGMQQLKTISEEVKGAAQRIIEAKSATYYGIGMAMVRIVRAVFGDENSILTVSSFLQGEYGQEPVCMGVPCVLGRGGVDRIIELSLSDEEQQALTASGDLLREAFVQLAL